MINDLRCTEQYLSKKQIETWKDRNILYNTLWFSQNIKGPDIEYSDAAIREYKKLKCYAKWKIVIKTHGQKVLEAPTYGVISADLMTGWWNPLRYFLKLDRSSNRKNLIKSLYDKYGKELENTSNEETVKWMTKTFSRNECACKKCLEFLKVVYTSGNMIPIASNYRSGSSLDGWDIKMYSLIEKTYKTNQSKQWNEYIQKTFNSVEKFIEQNKLQHYLNGDEVDLFWDKTLKGGFKEAHDEEWIKYFEKAERKISYRNELLNIIEK